MKYDVIIVGSGIAGLTSAAILSRNGCKVLIVEAQPRIGGALKRFKRQNIAFDVGFHYTASLGENEMLNRLWSYCGTLSDIHIKAFPEHGHDRLYIDSLPNPVRSYFSYDRFSIELKQLFPNQHAAIDSYFSIIQKICKDVPFYNFSLSLTDFLRGYKKRPRSLKKFITTITDDPRLQAVFFAPSLLYGVPAEQASLETHALVAHGYYSGAYDIAHGGQSIVQSFKKRLTKSGVDILTNMRVIKIKTDGKRVIGILNQHQDFFRGTNVIYTGHPSNLMDIVDPAFFRPAYRTRLKNLQNSISMFALFGTVSRKKTNQKLDWINHYLLPKGADLIPQSYQNSLHHRSLFLTSTEREHDNVNLPQDRKSVILLKPARWEEVKQYSKSSKQDRPIDYRNMKENIAETMRQTANLHWGEFLGPIETLAVGTPLTFHDELLAPEGCAYGAMHSLDQFNPDVRTRLPGLYLAGQSTLMTGVAGSSLSGMVSAGEIIGLEPLWEKIRKCH